MKFVKTVNKKIRRQGSGDRGQRAKTESCPLSPIPDSPYSVSCFPTMSGFTLIEILVVSAIITVLASLGLLMSFDVYRGFSFHSEVSTVASLLMRARSRSLANINQIPHGLHFESVCAAVSCCTPVRTGWPCNDCDCGVFFVTCTVAAQLAWVCRENWPRSVRSS